MNISEFGFRLLFLFLPGIIAHLLVDALTEHSERKIFQVVIYSFILGVGAYSSLYLWQYLFSLVSSAKMDGFAIHAFTQFQEDKATIHFGEILKATMAALPLALVVATLINYKVLHRLSHLMRITKKFADSDVWGFTFTSKDVEWVIVRDNPNNLYYEGFVRAFSATHEEGELLLEQVKVFKNDTGDLLYDIDALYLSRPVDALTIEVLKPLSTNYQQEQGEGNGTTDS